MSRMHFHIPSVDSGDDLLRLLSEVDISVAPRTNGRTKEQTEKWTVCHLLATLATEKQLTYPLKLTHSDRPDFVLRMGNTEVGVEVTEAVTQEYAAFAALAEREFPGALLDIGQFRLGAPRMTPDQMRSLLRMKQLSSEPWVGDSVEREWAAHISAAVEIKQAKLQNPGFRTFEMNWLAIYDNLPLPSLELCGGVEHLMPRLQRISGETISFDSIFIQRGPVIVRVGSQLSPEYYVVKDLW